MKRILIIVADLHEHELQVYNLSEFDFDPKELEELRLLHNDPNADLSDWFDGFIEAYSPIYDPWDKNTPGPVTFEAKDEVEIYYIIHSTAG